MIIHRQADIVDVNFRLIATILVESNGNFGNISGLVRFHIGQHAVNIHLGCLIDAAVHNLDSMPQTLLSRHIGVCNAGIAHIPPGRTVVLSQFAIFIDTEFHIRTELILVGNRGEHNKAASKATYNGNIVGHRDILIGAAQGIVPVCGCGAVSLQHKHLVAK